MKRWVTAALMLALLSAGMVRAETTGREDQKQGTQLSGTVIGGVNLADSTFHLMKVDGDNAVSILDSAPNRTTWTYWQNVIANNAMTPGLIDSTVTPIYVQPYRRLALYVYGNVDSLTSEARVAVQCRCHFTQSSDSLQTFPIPWRTTQSDSAGDIFTDGTGTTIDHTEKYWTIKDKQLLPHGDVIPVPVPNVEFPCPYLSVRLRLLTLSGSAGLSRLKVRVNIVGAAQ